MLSVRRTVSGGYRRGSIALISTWDLRSIPKIDDTHLMTQTRLILRFAVLLAALLPRADFNSDRDCFGRGASGWRGEGGGEGGVEGGGGELGLPRLGGGDGEEGLTAQTRCPPQPRPRARRPNSRAAKPEAWVGGWGGAHASPRLARRRCWR